MADSKNSDCSGDSQSKHHVTRPEDRVPLGQKLALGIGAFPSTTGTQIVQVMALPIFQIVLGCHPLLVGLALTIPRLWDAITDPVMGYISDNHRSRFGRRRPFILIGAVLMAFTFVGMWMVPKSWSERFADGAAVAQTEAAKDAAPLRASASEEGKPADAVADEQQSAEEPAERAIFWRDYWLFAWLLVASLLFYTCYTIFAVPLVSLSYEMTPDYHERTRVMAYWGFFTMAGNLCINWYYPLTEQTDLFSDPLQGARIVSLFVGGAIFVGLGVLPALFAKERLYRAASKQEKVKLFPAIGQTVQSRPMLMLLSMTLSLAFVGAMAAALAVYIVIFFVYRGDRAAGSIMNAWNGVGYQLVGFISIPVLSWVATRFGKRRAMFIVLGMAALGGVAKWFLFTPDLFFNLHLPGFQPVRLHLFLLDPILNAPIWTALGVIVPSMMADLCDLDEYVHGKRREGIFGAVFSWIQKVGFSMTFLFAGMAVWLSGFDEQLGAAQPEGTMFAMRLCFAGFSCLAMLLGMVFLYFYNVSEERAYEVRAELEQRRGKAWSSDEQ